MIATFWTLALVMCAAAAAFILVPLLRRRSSEPGADRTRTNVDIFEERLAELKESLAAGDLSQEDYDTFVAELQKNLLHDTVTEDAADNAAEPAPAQKKRFGRLPIVLAALVPLFAVFAYSGLGLSWGSINDVEFAHEFDTKKPHDKQSMEQSVEKLAASMQHEPDNDQGWFLLAQSYMSMEQYEKAASAFDHLLGRYPGDYNLAAYYAQALYLQDKREITPRVDEAIARTLKLNPHDISMWEIKAMDAYNKGEYAKSITAFRNALTGNPDDERKKMIEQAIAGVEKTMKDKGLEIPPEPEGAPALAMSGGMPPIAAAAAQAGDGKPAAKQGTRSLSVLVEIGDDVKAPDDASVFVYAKAASGPPMPLAVQRLKRTDLPKLVKLDDTMGMMQGMSLDNFDNVKVIARISTSGIANASPDDYEADSGEIDLTKPQSVIKLRIEHTRAELAEK